ncbi:HDOD domain-containing protein [Desulfoplanes sp. PS50]
MADPQTLHRRISKSLRLCQKTVFPPVMGKVLHEAMQPDPDLTRIADIIRMDPSLTAMVLALANSAYYNLSSPVSDIQRAAVVLGNKELVKLILFASFQKNCTSAGVNKGDLALIWNAIIWGATAAELLAERLDPKHVAKAYLCALLKDLSRILLMTTDEYPLLVSELTTFSPQQAALEQNLWGTTHELLTKELIDQWALPDICTEGILAHHDMDHLDQYSPLVQAVILGTRWAEVEFHHQGDPGPALHFSTLARRVLGLGDDQFSCLRTQVTEKFQAICEALDIPQLPSEERFFEHSIKSMQELYFLSMDIRHGKEGMASVVNSIGIHLKLHWGIERWDLALRTPFEDNWIIYHDPHRNLASKAVSPADIPWKLHGPTIDLKDAGKKIGSLRLDGKDRGMAKDRDLHLYFRFVGQHVASYLANQARVESKAQTLDAIPVGVARLNAVGTILQTNAHFKAIKPGLTDPKGKNLLDILTSEFGYPKDAELNAFFQDTQQSEYSRIFCPLNGPDDASETCIYLSVHKKPEANETEHIALVEDISKVRSIEFDILRQRTFLHNLISSMQDIVMTVDHDGKITYVSPLGSPSWLGKNLFHLTRPEKTTVARWNPSYLKQSGTPVEVTMGTGTSGKQGSYELIISELTRSPLQYLVVGRDVSQIRRLEKKLKHQATFDSLTKIFNRYQFDIALAEEVKKCTRTGRSLGMIFFDVDNFKGFNDQYGHQAGDKVLAGIGSILRASTRQGMDIPCRYGGDEFVVLATEIGHEPLYNLASRIKELFGKHFAKDLSLSIGIALYNENESPELFLARADKAGYTAKSRGGNRIVVAE